jgi:WD40 repeat protein
MDNGIPALDWLPDGTLLCEQRSNTLVRIPEDGGRPDTIVSFGTSNPVWIHALPGEAAALVVLCPLGSCTRESFLSVVDLRADTAWTVRDDVIKAWYVDTGHVVWVRRDGAVYATLFDLDQLEMSDSDVPLFEGVRTSGTTLMVADIVMGKDGTVVYVEGARARIHEELVWVDREGHEEAFEVALSEGATYPDFSPDGARIAVSSLSGDRNVWVIDLSRGVPQMLLTGGSAIRPAWGPDGRTVTFTSGGVGRNEIWTIPADGGGDVEILFDADRRVADAVWSPDGAWLIFRTSQFDDDSGDIMAWQVGQDTPSIPIVATEFQELAPTLSPNGRFLAYSSNRSGVSQVYVQPFPNVDDGMWQISGGGGTEPIWANDGTELFYRKGGGGDLVAVQVSTDGSFQIGQEHVLFPAARYGSNSLHPLYDVSPDDQRFLMLRSTSAEEDAPPPRMIMTLNFFTELEERLGGGD